MSMSTSSCRGTSRVRVHCAPPLTSSFRPRKRVALAYARIKRPVEERFNILCERNVSQKRLEELCMENWSKWESGKCKLYWEWQVDQQVYIVKGSVRVVPNGCDDNDDGAWFYAGDLVRYPKWLEASLYFQGPYEERYRFLAYGDD